MNAEQAKTTQDKVRDLQRRLYVTAKSQPTRKFHALYDKVYRPDVLRRAWENVRANRGAPGIDRTTIEDVEARGVDAFLEEIRLELQEGRYRPVPLRRVYIPKKDGRKRGLGIPVLKDRICQAAAKIVLEPVIEADFLPCSYGFRPKRNALQAMEAIRVAGNKGQSWVVDFDIKGAFDHIAHESIMQALARRVSDRRMLGLIKGWLRCGVMEEGRLRTTTAGTPQGGVISPLLANLVFHHLDEALNHLGRWATFARYADDGLVLTWTRAQAEHALEVVKDTVQRHGMELNVE
ncbi:MAG: group II intron reverse transcriptase/maturase, partial [Clostridia bacterium]